MENEITKSGSYNVFSLFAGIGGICDSFTGAGCTISLANELDRYACMTYRHNHPDCNLIEGDIHHLNGKCIKTPIDIITGGFPCQSFSNAGNQKAFEDPRGKLFFEIMRILDGLIENKNKPKALFFENVGHLKTIDGGETLKTIENEIKSREYSLVDPFILNSKDYGGIPQFRNRIYMVAFDNKEDKDSFKLPETADSCFLKDIIDIEDKKPDWCYYSPKNAKHFDLFEETVKKYHTVYQYRRYYMRENKSNLCPALTANMGMGGHNVPIVLDKYGIRKLTVEECLKLQGFDSGFTFPDIANSHKYKQIGNSVTVPVVRTIAKNMVETLNKSY